MTQWNVRLSMIVKHTLDRRFLSSRHKLQGTVHAAGFYSKQFTHYLKIHSPVWYSNLHWGSMVDATCWGPTNSDNGPHRVSCMTSSNRCPAGKLGIDVSWDRVWMGGSSLNKLAGLSGPSRKESPVNKKIHIRGTKQTPGKNLIHSRWQWGMSRGLNRVTSNGQSTGRYLQAWDKCTL